jgi:hypothetical protein
VAVNCSTTLLFPHGFHLSYNQLAPLPKKVVNGNIDDLNAALYEELLAKIDHWRMLIKNYYKGCSQKTVPMCLCFIAQNLQPFARSIM